MGQFAVSSLSKGISSTLDFQESIGTDGTINQFKTCLKGALDKYNIIPQHFQKKVGIFIPLEVFAWVMAVC